METVITLPEIQPMNKPRIEETPLSAPRSEISEIRGKGKERLKIKPKLNIKIKSYHEDGYIWGISFLYNSRFKICISSLNFAVVFFYILLKIAKSEDFSNNENLEKILKFVLYANIIENIILILDVFYHTNKGSNSDLNIVIIIIHILRTLNWICCLLYIKNENKIYIFLYLEFALELIFTLKEILTIIGMAIATIFAMICVAICAAILRAKSAGGSSFQLSYSLSRGKGYINILTFLNSIFNVLFWPRILGVYSSSWGWSMSIVLVVLFFPSVAFLLYLVTLIQSKENFKIAEFLLLSTCFCSFFLIFFLDGFFENESFNKVVIFIILLYFFISSAIVVLKTLPKIETYDNSGSRARFIRQKSYHQKLKDTNSGEKKKDLKKYLSLKRVETNVFAGKDVIEERSKFDSSDRGKFCLVCYVNEPCVIYKPCLHGGICEGCARDVAEAVKECPFCKKDLDEILLYKKDDEGLYKCGEISLIN